MTTSPEIAVVCDEGGLTTLEPEWRDLWERDPAATPFQSPAWLVPWVRNFAGPDWLVATMRRRGRLIALLPLFCVDDLNGRRLLSMGAGISDYGDGVFDPEVGCGSGVDAGHGAKGVACDRVPAGSSRIAAAGRVRA